MYHENVYRTFFNWLPSFGCCCTALHYCKLQVAKKKPKNNKHLNAYTNKFSTRLLSTIPQMFNIINVCQGRNNPRLLVARTTKLCAVIFIKIQCFSLQQNLCVSTHVPNFKGQILVRIAGHSRILDHQYENCILEHRIWRWFPDFGKVCVPNTRNRFYIYNRLCISHSSGVWHFMDQYARVVVEVLVKFFPKT
jgi:hypothetical protein